MSEGSSNTQVRKADGVLTVRLNRPDKRNALSRAVLTELETVFTQYRDDHEVKVAVLTGAGDKAFAAGGDLSDFNSIRSEEDAEALFRLANQALNAIRTFPVPTVAALNGTAVGGGAEVAVACDFRVAASHATIGYVHARLAITSGFGGGADLMRLLGANRALMHMLRAEVLNAEVAKAMGLVDEVADADEPLDACLERFIGPIRKRPEHVLRAIKALAVARGMGKGREELEALERRCFAQTWAHRAHWDALERAFSTKRRN